MKCKKCTARITRDDYEVTQKGTIITCPNCGHTRLIPTYPDAVDLVRVVLNQIETDHKPKKMGE